MSPIIPQGSISIVFFDAIHELLHHDLLKYISIYWLKSLLYRCFILVRRFWKRALETRLYTPNWKTPLKLKLNQFSGLFMWQQCTVVWSREVATKMAYCILLTLGLALDLKLKTHLHEWIGFCYRFIRVLKVLPANSLRVVLMGFRNFGPVQFLLN